MSPSRTSRRLSRSSLAGLALLATPAWGDPGALVLRQVRPSLADPAVRQFDEPSVAITAKAMPADAPLVVFLPGTGGKPENALPALRVAAQQGYRVLGLEYDDDPAVVQVCPRDPDPACSADFREMRLTGGGRSTTVANPTAEAIVPRLVAALRLLAKVAPDEGWGRYLDSDQPRWSEILVSGLSQGAGMAAYIAKQHAVRRVVLFSSPWDFTGPERRPAPWLYPTGATPVERWYAEYNTRENTVPLIRAAYAALKIPRDHIRVFALDLPAGRQFNGPNPYHGITIHDLRYTPDWQAMFGKGIDAP